MRNKIILLAVIVAAVAGIVVWRVFYATPAESPGSGLYAEITQERGYKGVITVYDESGTAEYKWPSADEYIIAVKISPSADTMAVITLSGNGCGLKVFSLETGGERGSYLSSDCMFYDLGYLTDGEIYAIGSDRAVIFDNAAIAISAYAFPDEYLSDYLVTDNHLTLLLSGYRASDKSRSVRFSGTDWIDINS
ncbi:MAG: hypothetical protein LBN43_04150 [Oscillospiraceae bacterium]|jgi:hypothetical protein|nr:hypothetical protein [Oscillospiraceae bacterium]